MLVCFAVLAALLAVFATLVAVFAVVLVAALAFAGVVEFKSVIGGTVTGEFAFGLIFDGALTSTLAFVFAAGVSVVASGFVDKTEMSPFNAGIASINADNIKRVAATIVVFDKTVAVPRAP